MKIAVIGATGFVGSNVVKELVLRNHDVLGISRKKGLVEDEHLHYGSVDIFNEDELAKAVAGYDVVVNAFFPGFGDEDVCSTFLKGLISVQKSVKKSGVKRLIVIGEAGSLYVSEGVQFFDTPDYPEEYTQGSKAANEYLKMIKEEKELDWAYFCPAPEMHEGITTGRTGKYRLGLESPVYNDEQRSIISVEDVGYVITDEIENHKHSRVRFTAAY